MKQTITTRHGSVRTGSSILITKVDDKSFMFPSGTDSQAKEMEGLSGIVESIDDMEQLHGTWGGLAVLPEADEFVVLSY